MLRFSCSLLCMCRHKSYEIKTCLRGNWGSEVCMKDVMTSPACTLKRLGSCCLILEIHNSTNTFSGYISAPSYKATLMPQISCRGCRKRNSRCFKAKKENKNNFTAQWSGYNSQGKRKRERERTPVLCPAVLDFVVNFHWIKPTNCCYCRKKAQSLSPRQGALRAQAGALVLV